ncbi:hypothetical protein B0T25DRAFT_574594 [Lasiosphaeria hispida]|uniref:Cytochrome P450 n=1 Tax=Lasiosphaeria hispida TaxID=260671 RepID=A0AAJ0H4Y8_9PEZI|nr:hypothetical protein B0T25DRAFT_574594 [Lasiosphaeria hispida]
MASPLRPRPRKVYHKPEKPDDQPYPHRLEIASNLYDQSLAAIENTASHWHTLHYELARRPDVQPALRMELLAAEPHLIASDNTFRDLKAVDSLRLLDAIVTETLRIYPPSAVLFRALPPDLALRPSVVTRAFRPRCESKHRPRLCIAIRMSSQSPKSGVG